MDGYYEALAFQTQQMIDLGKWGDRERNQISTVFDKDLIQDYQENELERLSKLNKDQLQLEKESFASAVYGNGAVVSDNTILDA
jgi:hypothetical protein